MNTFQYIQIAGTIASLIGMLFLAYRSIIIPQYNTKIDDAKIAEQFKNTLEQVASMQRDLVNLRDNHVHTIDLKLDQQKESMQTLALKVTELATIINERIPKCPN